MIPEEAVEAAAKAFYEASTGKEWAVRNNFSKNHDRHWMRGALEVAAPYIQAEALRLAAHSMELLPPLLRAQYVATLRLYADEPWRLGDLHESPSSPTSDNRSKDD